jgi:hypothetical protein
MAGMAVIIAPQAQTPETATFTQCLQLLQNVTFSKRRDTTGAAPGTRRREQRQSAWRPSGHYAGDVPIPNAYHVTFSGPKDAEPGLVDALTKAGLAAETCSPMYDYEADLGWVRVLAHEGYDDPPSPEFQRQIRARSSEVAHTFGYAERASGITAGMAYRLSS